MTAQARENLKIWQIFYRTDQYPVLDSGFIPLNNADGRAESLEFAVFQQLAASPETQGLSHWGALSWRFGEKTGLSSQALIELVQQQPEVDVFFMNPYPQHEALHVSPWWHGETAHPEFIDISEAFFIAAGLPVEEINRLTPPGDYSFCNYFVGGPRFWAAYLSFVEQALAQAEQRMPEPLLQKLHSTTADPKGIHHGATYLPFIIERLFAVFMRTAGTALKAVQVRLPACEARLGRELQVLRQLKNVAVLTSSVSLLAQWQERRKLYLEQHASPVWQQLHLRRLMSASISW